MLKKDKILHFLYCFVLSLAGWYGVAFACIAAITKEYYDSQKQGNFWSWGDIAADFVGMGAGIVIHLLIKNTTM